MRNNSGRNQVETNLLINDSYNQVAEEREQKLINSKKWFAQIREAIANAEVRPSTWADKELPSGQWSIYSDLQRTEFVR